MPGIDSIVHQPQSASPPDQQGSSGTAPQSGIQPLVQGGQGSIGAPPTAPPTHQETVAVLRHFGEMSRHWRMILSDPNIGKQSIRGDVYNMAADLLGDGFLTLPEIMTELKTLPTDPLEQKQWVEKHYQTAQMAMTQILHAHALGNPPPQGDFASENAALPMPTDAEGHGRLLRGLVGRVQSAMPKKVPAPPRLGGIPLRQ